MSAVTGCEVDSVLFLPVGQLALLSLHRTQVGGRGRGGGAGGGRGGGTLLHCPPGYGAGNDDRAAVSNNDKKRQERDKGIFFVC